MSDVGGERAKLGKKGVYERVMQNISKFGERLILAFLVGLALTSSAHAYLDPGTGSIILQLLLGGIAGGLVIGKLYWHQLLVMLGIRKDAKQVAGRCETPQAESSEPRSASKNGG